MLGQLLLHLLWLSSVYSETVQNKFTNDNAMVATPENPVSKIKRGLIANPPCPSFNPHVNTYLPPPIYSRPYEPPVYPKKEVIVPTVETSNHVQFIHQPIYSPPIKQTVSYEKPIASAISYQTIHKPLLQHVQPIVNQVPLSIVTPKVTFEKPLLPYHTNLVQPKPIIQPISYPKPWVDNPTPVQFSPINFKKYELPAPQIVHQKPTILLNTPPCNTPPRIHPPPQSVIHVSPQPIEQSKLIHVPLQVSYTKVPHLPVLPMHQIAYPTPTVHSLSAVSAVAPLSKLPEFKVGHTCVK